MCQERCLSKLVQVHRFSDRFFYLKLIDASTASIAVMSCSRALMMGRFFVNVFFSLQKNQALIWWRVKGWVPSITRLDIDPTFNWVFSSKWWTIGEPPDKITATREPFPGFFEFTAATKPKFVLKNCLKLAMFLTWQNCFTRISFGQSQAVSSTITRHKGEQGPAPMPLVYLTHQTARIGWQDNWNGGWHLERTHVTNFSFRLKCVVVWTTLLPNSWNV